MFLKDVAAFCSCIACQGLIVVKLKTGSLMILFSFCFVQLSDGLNAVPMTEREKRECALVLSPQQLKLVDIGNSN